MRATTNGLHKGSRIHVAGARKHGNGTISREPSDVRYLFYRCDYNMGEHLAKIGDVRRIDGPRL
ncbi:MAG: hypothetical protein ACYDDQ_01775 [Vulcanimicrobiaceae bacterium]